MFEKVFNRVETCYITGMKKKNAKTFSVLEAARLVKCSRAIVSRLCQHGMLGTRHELPDGAGHCYRLDSADIAALRARKKRWESRISKKHNSGIDTV